MVHTASVDILNKELLLVPSRLSSPCSPQHSHCSGYAMSSVMLRGGGRGIVCAKCYSENTNKT
jgi:hypothetical protein